MSKIKYVTGDLFQHVDKRLAEIALLEEDDQKTILIPHVVNDVKAWGAGFVVALSQYSPYPESCYQGRGELELGQNIYAPLQDYEDENTGEQDTRNVIVVNMIAQKGVGGVKPLQYWALGACLGQVTRKYMNVSYEIHAPKFGSGLAGGNWYTIEEMIQECWVDRGYDVTIYKR